MRLTTNFPKGYAFLFWQALISFLYGYSMILWNQWAGNSIQDELLFLLLPPIFYVAYSYSHRYYIYSTLFAFGISLWAVSRMEINLDNSLKTIFISGIAMLFSAEGIFRMNQAKLRTEAELLDSRSRWRAIFHGSEDVMFTKDEMGRIVSSNNAFCRLLDKKPEQIEGKNVFDLFEPAQAILMHLSDKQVWKGEIVKSEMTFQTHDRIRTISLTKIPLFTKEKKIFEICAIGHDITEIKETEKERERLISELREAMANVRQLSGLLPICASCKKIRDDRGDWKQIDEYIQVRTDTEFTHGLCPECSKEY